MLRKALLASLGLALLVTLRPGSVANAYNNYVNVDVACAQGGGVDALISWSSAATQSSVDISLRNNNWQMGTYVGLGSVAGGRSIMAAGLMPNALYFVRVTQLLQGGWVDESPTLVFRTPGDCALLLAKQVVIVSTSESDDSGSPQASSDENCHPNYYGACLNPDSEDYDCEGGGGNGPDFIRGPVYISGSDPFGLDRNGDGIGCNE
ncbi:MAG TPA: hypothetical protein VJB57_19665 [Dehalococcoidia bacterium]|nr:hypothetical protein [Dehalococcoidia bacterium]